MIFRKLVAWQQRYEQGLTSKPPPKVASVFIPPTETNTLYVECRSPADCGRIMSVFNYSPDTTLVSLEDRPQLLPLFTSGNQPAMETLDDNLAERLSTHVWVRTRDGDIAYVVDTDSDARQYDVLRLPVLPLEDGGSSRRLLSRQDILALLDPGRKSGRYKTVSPTSTLFWVAKGSRRRVFLGGLEQVSIPFSRTTTVDSPNPQDLLPFVEAREISLLIHPFIHDQDDESTDGNLSLLSPLKGTFFPSDEFEWLTADTLLQYAERFCSSTLDIGDRVAVKDSAPTELHGAVGFIVESDADHMKVQDVSEGLVYTVHRNHLRKVFKTGDSVRVSSGSREGMMGLVLTVDDQVIHLLSGSMEELQKSELSYQQSNSVRTHHSFVRFDSFRFSFLVHPPGICPQAR